MCVDGAAPLSNTHSPTPTPTPRPTHRHRHRHTQTHKHTLSLTHARTHTHPEVAVVLKQPLFIFNPNIDGFILHNRKVKLRHDLETVEHGGEAREHLRFFFFIALEPSVE